MQNYLFIAGNYDGLDIPVPHDLDVVPLPRAGSEEYIYHRDTLTVGDASITIYRHESLTSAQVLNRLVEHYKAWCVNRPGGLRH